MPASWADAFIFPQKCTKIWRHTRITLLRLGCSDRMDYFRPKKYIQEELQKMPIFSVNGLIFGIVVNRFMLSSVAVMFNW